VRIEFAVKHGVRPFGPPLPDPNETHFCLDTNLREFILSKCMALFLSALPNVSGHLPENCPFCIMCISDQQRASSIESTCFCDQA